MKKTSSSEQTPKKRMGELMSCRAIRWVVILIIAVAAVQVGAFGPKGIQDNLDLLVFTSPELRIVESLVASDTVRETLASAEEIDRFRSDHGSIWEFTIDQRRGWPSLVGGGAIPFIPGPANSLEWNNIEAGCQNIHCLSDETVEGLARDFLSSYKSVFPVNQEDLVIDPDGTLAIGRSIYLLRFQWHHGGIPVEGGSIYFRINNGNLIQVATEKIGPISLDPQPSLSVAEARVVLDNYLGVNRSVTDLYGDLGSLRIVPVTPSHQNIERFEGAIGSGITYRLAYRFAFNRPGVIGTWEALIDAHDGEIIRFVDANRYGRVHGGAYPGDNHVGEADRPFPFADTGLPSPNNYTDASGTFEGDSATTTLKGKYTWINDYCGSINNSTTTGDVDFSLGSGTDCAVPPGNPGGTGNTHSARTQYWHLTNANIHARTFMPDNNGLNNNHMTINVNQSANCNASSGGGTLYFYKGVAGTCWNLGEIPGVALHEWGHSMDDWDGSGSSSPPVETRADWTASLQLHDSCVGRGFWVSGNCSGYGDPCLDCNGVRDNNYHAHANATPWTAANYNTFWSNCEDGNYFGPCGLEDHCEAGISSQALWEFVTNDLVGPPTNMDLTSAWALADRLFYTSMPTLSNLYTCSMGSNPTSSGGNGSSLYNTMMAIDDDGDGVGNGTPHAAAIFAALDRNNIANGIAADPKNQNFTSCPALTLGAADAVGGNNAVHLTWDAIANATLYNVFRNEISCDAGFTNVGQVDSPTTTFTDENVVNGIEYYYRLQASTDSDSCVSPMSDCMTVVPVPCETPQTPTALVAAGDGDNRIVLDWSNDDPVAETFNVYRAIGACPQADYHLIASGVTGLTYADDPVSGGADISYVIAGVDSTAGCESIQSNCADAQTTGACTLAPQFGGIESIVNSATVSCALELSWSRSVNPCGGQSSYNIYRSLTPGFTPGPDNLLNTVGGRATYTDADGLVAGTTYYYVIRAIDLGNGLEETNLVEMSGASGVETRFADDFENGNQGWTFSLGSPAATSGDFLIGDPVATTGNSPNYGDSQPGDDHTPGAGVNCLYTDENPSGDAGTNDIDNGEVVAVSPSFDGTGVESLELDLWRWFFNEDNDDSGDYFFLEVSNNDGATWTVLENIPGTDTTTNHWTNLNFTLETYLPLTSTMKLRFRAADGTSVGDLVEAAIDDIVVSGYLDCSIVVDPDVFADDFESGNTSGWSVTFP